MRTRSVRIGVLRLGTRSATATRVHPAPISFPYFCGSSPDPSAERRKRKKGNGCGLFRHFVLQKSRKVATLPNSLFSVLVAPEALAYTEYVVTLTFAHTVQAPRIGRSHSFAMPARCLLRVCSMTSAEFVVVLFHP